MARFFFCCETETLARFKNLCLNFFFSSAVLSEVKIMRKSKKINSVAECSKTCDRMGRCVYLLDTHDVTVKYFWHKNDIPTALYHSMTLQI